MGRSGSRSDVAENQTEAVAQPLVGAQIRYSSLATIFLLWIAIYFASIFSPALLDDVDTIHAEAARKSYCGTIG